MRQIPTKASNACSDFDQIRSDLDLKSRKIKKELKNNLTSLTSSHFVSRSFVSEKTECRNIYVAFQKLPFSAAYLRRRG